MVRRPPRSKLTDTLFPYTTLFRSPALPGYRVEVRDENGNALPARHIGRIFAHGPSLMEGYYGNAEESARVLSPDGWLDTGDLGYLTAGQIVITGRAQDPIRSEKRSVGHECVSTFRSRWSHDQ